MTIDDCRNLLIMKDNLEKAFHDALVNNEVPYDPKAWDALKKQLPVSKTPWYLFGGPAAALIIAVVLYAVLYTNETSVVEKANATNQQEDSTSQVKEEHYSAVENANPVVENGALPPQSEKKLSRQDKAPSSQDKAADATITSEPQFMFAQPGQPQLQLGLQSHEDKSAVIAQENTQLQLQGVQSYYCENSPVKLQAINVPSNSSVSWKLSNGKILQGTSVEFLAEKNLEVYLLENKSNSSVINTVIKQKINVVEAEKPAVEVISKEKNTKTYVTLLNTNPDIEHLLWRFDNIVSQEQSCGTYLTSKGVHNYVVESYDKNGCFASISGQIEVNNDYNLYVENTFTPNGDGINDNFLPEALKMRSVNFKMSIFDKNGKLIYTTTDVHSPWNGTLNGQALPQDTYIWTVSLINEEGAPEQYRGTIFLDR